MSTSAAPEEAKTLEHELIDLVLMLAAAVEEAVFEFVSMQETGLPLPGGIREGLEERQHLIATLKRVSTEGGAQRLAEARTREEVRTFVEAVYREERERHREVPEKMPNWPVEKDVERQVGEAFETFQRAAWLLPELRAALRGSQLGMSRY